MHSGFKKLIRLFVDEAPYGAGASLALTDHHRHYLKNVMRKQEGDCLRVFNGQDGEWLAEITEMGKKSAVIRLKEPLREQRDAKDIWVVASPVKKAAQELMVEKACELGACRFVPVICDHTVVHKLNEDRLQAMATEAAEQSERLNVMQVAAPASLKDLVLRHADRTFLVCLERAEAPPITAAVAACAGSPMAVVIGPEGGFSETEAEFFASVPHVRIVSLGEQVLRAETAMIAALAVAVLGSGA